MPNNQQWLREQYKDSSHLGERIQLYRYSTNPLPWRRWVFDQFKIAPGSRILELGCGNGELWQANLDRLPQDWQITLSDFSPGMLQDAQKNLQASQHPFTFQVIDAHSIPGEDASLDIVIANHMLYYISDRSPVYANIRRLLKPSGRLYASTVSNTHLKELDDLIRRVKPDFNRSNPFTLESGLPDLSRQFAHVNVYRHEQQLIVPTAEPIMTYLFSGSLQRALPQEQIQEQAQALRAIVQEEIQEKGAITIHAISGLFEAYDA